MAGSDAAIFHLVDPIAGLGNGGIVRGEKQCFPASLDDFLKQLKGTLGIGGVEVAGRFVRQDHPRVVGQGTRERHALLFAPGKMAAGSAQFVA